MLLWQIAPDSGVRSRVSRKLAAKANVTYLELVMANRLLMINWGENAHMEMSVSSMYGECYRMASIIVSDHEMACSCSGVMAKKPWTLQPFRSEGICASCLADSAECETGIVNFGTHSNRPT
jgi:hypothetical protein